MIASPSTLASQHSAPAGAIALGEVEASCRWPLFALFGGAAFWLAVGAVFGLLASIKFHGPNFLADSAWLTYGRVYAAATNALVFGFGIPAALGAMLWMLCRLGRVKLAAMPVAFTAAKLWHAGVFFGLLGILRGQSTGFEWLEMPRYAAVMLFAAFVALAVCGLVTFHRRSERALYASSWFILAALFWFPWIYSTAILLLEFFPVRGVVQAAVAWWFAGNLLVVWMSLAGLAVTFYLLPKLTGRPLQSHYYALFAFWTLILFGTWTGIPAGATLPSWMPALSQVAAVVVLVTWLTVAASAILTCRGANAPCGGGPLCYTKFGTFALVLSGLMLALSVLPGVSRVVNFTWFGVAETHLRVYGFFATTMFAAVYYILPRVAGVEFPFAKLIRVHLWLIIAGMVLLVVPLAVAGVKLGAGWLNPELSNVAVTKPTLMMLRLATLGEWALLLGSLLFLLNVLGLVGGYVRSLCRVTWAEAVAPVETAEVRS